MKLHNLHNEWKLFNSLLKRAWAKKSKGGDFSVRDRRAGNGEVISFSLPRSLKIIGTYPSPLEIWLNDESDYVAITTSLLVGDVWTNGVQEENFLFKFYPKGDLYNLLRRNDFEEDDAHHFVFPLKFDSLGYPEQKVSVVQEIDQSLIEVRQYWTIISRKGSNEFKSLFPKIDVSKNENELETLANNIVEWLYKYMTEDSPKLFKKELNDAINEVFDIIKKRIENKN